MIGGQRHGVIQLRLVDLWSLERNVGGSVDHDHHRHRQQDQVRQGEISAVRIKMLPSGPTWPERYFRRAISSMAGRFSRKTSSLFL
jgi:hypothetical protein